MPGGGKGLLSSYDSDGVWIDDGGGEGDAIPDPVGLTPEVPSQPVATPTTPTGAFTPALGSDSGQVFGDPWQGRLKAGAIPVAAALTGADSSIGGSVFDTLKSSFNSMFNSGNDKRDAAALTMAGSLLSGMFGASDKKKAADAAKASAEANVKLANHKIDSYNASQMSNTSFGKVPRTPIKFSNKNPRRSEKV